MPGKGIPTHIKRHAEGRFVFAGQRGSATQMSKIYAFCFCPVLATFHLVFHSGFWKFGVLLSPLQRNLRTKWANVLSRATIICWCAPLNPIPAFLSHHSSTIYYNVPLGSAVALMAFSFVYTLGHYGHARNGTGRWFVEPDSSFYFRFMQARCFLHVPMAVLPSTRLRYVYICSRHEHAQSQSAHRPAKATPPLYLLYLCMYYRRTTPNAADEGNAF